MLNSSRVKQTIPPLCNRPQMHWGQRLKLEREAAELTQTEIGAVAGVTKGAVSQWENGGNIKPENLFAVAEKLKVSARWLATGKGERARTSQELTDDEAALLDRYRKLPDVFRRMLLADTDKYLGAAFPNDGAPQQSEEDSAPPALKH